MATVLKPIEREFILNTAKDEGLDLILKAQDGEWPVRILGLTKDALSLSHALPLRLLKVGETYEFRFIYREQGLAFRARLLEAREGRLTTAAPTEVLKDLGRRYSRKQPPKDFSATLAFRGDRYELEFPQTKEYDPVEAPKESKDFDPADIRLLVHEFNAKASVHASEHGIVMYKGRQPESLQERVVAATGKILYLPSSVNGLPRTDPYPQSRIITRDGLRAWLQEGGSAPEDLDREVQDFERGLRKDGVLSELLIPIIFQEYVAGCIRLVNKDRAKQPFDLEVLETYQQFSKILAYSLKLSGYFSSGIKRTTRLPAGVVDLSAGGILFASDSQDLVASLLPGSEVEVSLKIGGRRIQAGGRVLRVYGDGRLSYFGIQYDRIEPEDFRFIFETLYGRPFTDDDGLGYPGLSPRSRPGRPGDASGSA